MGVEQLELVAVVGVLLIVASSYFAGKFGVATPIALVLLGLGLSFLPGMRVRIERWLQRHHADSRFYAGNGLGLRGGAVIAWAGMRGVVTLAAAQSLPLDFPYRSQLVLLAFVVALVTLVGQGGTLPLLIRVLGIRGTDEEQAQRELSLLLGELREASAVQVLDNPDLKRRGGEPFDSAVLEKVRQLHNRSAEPGRSGAPESPEAQLPELTQLLLEVQQDALNEARSIGAYDSGTIARAQRMLDAGAARRGGL